MPFLDAIAALADCRGDEQLAFRRLAGTSGKAFGGLPVATASSGGGGGGTNGNGESSGGGVNNGGNHKGGGGGGGGDDDEDRGGVYWGPPRVGDAYKAELALGAAVAGAEAARWMSQKRVKKDWAEILARQHAAAGVPTGEGFGALGHGATVVDDASAGGGIEGGHAGPADLAGWW